MADIEYTSQIIHFTNPRVVIGGQEICNADDWQKVIYNQSLLTKTIEAQEAEIKRLREIVEWLALDHNVKAQTFGQAVYWAQQFEIAHNKAQAALKKGK